MRLSAIIPCYHEPRTTDARLSTVHPAPDPDKVLIAADCTGEGTRQLPGRLLHPGVPPAALTDVVRPRTVSGPSA